MESDLMQQMVTFMLPSPDALRLDTLLLDVDHNRVILEVASMQEVLICPGCGRALPQRLTAPRGDPCGRPYRRVPPMTPTADHTGDR
ncbi:MAG: hypothetical protein ACKO4U_06395, partial [Caldilinea sp.]